MHLVFRFSVVLIIAVFTCSSGLMADEDTPAALGEMTVVASPIIQGNTVDRYGSGQTLITRTRSRPSTPRTSPPPCAEHRGST